MIKRAKALLSGDGLGARARRGSLLTIFVIGYSNALRLGRNLILTRLLFPEAFGLMALVAVVQGGARLFSDLGVNASVVQHRRGEELAFLQTAWTVQLIRGFLLYGIVVLCATSIANLYNQPLLEQILLVAGLALIAEGCIPIRDLQARRNLQLGRLSIIDVVAPTVNSVVVITLAWYLQSVWALVIGGVTGTILRIVLVYCLLSGPKDGLAFDKSALRDIIRFGAFILIGSAAAFASTAGDRAILGAFVHIDLVGIFSIALGLATLPNTLGQALAQRIVFPLYSRRPPQESLRNRQQLAKARLFLSLGVFGMSLILIVVGDPLIKVLFDPRYELAGGITVLVVVGLLPRLVTLGYGPVLLSNGRSDLNALYTITFGTVQICALYFGIKSYGIMGAALAPAFAGIITYPLLVTLIRPYRAWNPKHDALFFAVTVAFFALAWVLESDVILQVAATAT